MAQTVTIYLTDADGAFLLDADGAYLVLVITAPGLGGARASAGRPAAASR